MKANRQERIIAGITAGLIGTSAMLLFINGLGENNLGESVKSTTEQSAAAKVSSIDTDSTDSILSLSSLDAYMVASPFTKLTEQGNETDAAETEQKTETEGAAETETETEAETEPVEPYKYENTFIANVSEYLNIRSVPSTDGEVVGKIYAGGGGQVIEKGAQWSKVVSGNAEGYINNDYAWFAQDAEAHMPEVCTMYGVSNADSLRVRKGPGTDWKVIATVNAGAEVQVLGFEGDWAKVNYIGTEAYIFAEYLETEYYIESGVTIEEEQEAIRLEQERLAEEQRRAEEAEAARQQKIQNAIANSSLTETVQTSAYNVSEEDVYLLACTVCAEAGYESYDGKLAVANIILNRLNGGAYGSTIYDVVYAKGQFSVVTNGALNRVINNGPNAESMQAAKDALAGKNNVPRYTGFCALRSANYDLYSEYSIICNQVFYRR